MKAEDTYMSPLFAESSKLKHMGVLNDDVMALLNEQAEISFKAGLFKAGEGIWDKIMGAKKSGYEEGLFMGRKEAVEVMDELLGASSSEWRTQLKKWGIKNDS